MPFFSEIVDGQVLQPTKKIFVFGNSAHTRTIFGYFFDEHGVHGFAVDDAFVNQQPSIGGMSVYPSSQMLDRFPPDEYAVMVAVGFHELNEFRMRKSEALRALGYDLVGFMDRSVRVPWRYSVGANTIILGHADIHEACSIGEGVFVSTGAALGHDSVLEAYSWIGTGVSLAGGVRVGAFSLLGMNVSVRQHAQLAHHTLVSPNSFVNMDTAAYASVVGGQAVPIDSRKLIRFSVRP